MRIYLKMWCISVIFFYWETYMLFWAFCSHVSFVNLLISFEQFFFFSSYNFWWVLRRKLDRYVRTLWGHVMEVYLRPFNKASNYRHLWWTSIMTSFKSILEDDSISSTSKACIHSCSSKGRGYGWLLNHLLVCFVSHILFSPSLCFHLGLIQPLSFSFLTCECGHGLHASNMHLTYCLFGGQWIATHDTIRNVMYALAQDSGHDVWMVIHPYIKTFIISWFLHDLWGPDICC
jgi:hypothetical protein